MSSDATFTAFLGDVCLASGGIEAVARAAAAGAGAHGAVLILDDATGQPIELDFRAGPQVAAAEYRARTDGLPDTPPRRPGRGRPRLGVVAREVTLLPRHWDWLAGQPGGASATLRRLVEDARRASADEDQARRTQEALYRAMSVLAGNAPGYEDATRALFARDDDRLDALVSAWPADIATYIARLAKTARAARGV